MFVHYSLAPEHRYPVALDQVVRVYAWLRMHCPRVVVFGESAGGNLAAALTLRCIDGGLPVPDGMVLGYPAVNLNSSPSPSRAMHLNDPLIPVGESRPRAGLRLCIRCVRLLQRPGGARTQPRAD